MKCFFIGLILSPLLLFNSSCNDDDPDLCTESMILNESFIGKKGCEYSYIASNGDIINVSILGIADNREYGAGCAVSWGGSADISVKASFNQSKRLKTFTWSGCDGLEEYDPNLETLPKLELEGGYTLKIMKMYPLSETQEESPELEEEYGIRLIIMK